jgi:hypothetical protein
VLLVLAVGTVLLTRDGDAASPAPAPATGPAAAARVPDGTLDPAAARAALTRLRVGEKGPLSGYERGCGAGEGCVFGPAWADVDRNGCDQRDDVLRRDLADVQVREGTRGCVVTAGRLTDPYTGRPVDFRKADAAQVPIDHVVPLAAAWAQGAAGWPAERRAAFAGDLGNLLATTRAQNSAKGDATAEQWVPPADGYGCSYGAVVVTVKARYALTVTPEEQRALGALLDRC